MTDSNADIWRLQAQSDVRGLIEVLRHENPDTRRRSAAALRALGATSAIPALQAILARENDPSVRAAIILTLDHLFQQEVDDESDDSDDPHTLGVRLIAQLSSDNPEHIISAAHRLGELKEKLAAEPLIMIFHDLGKPGRVRLAAAEALIELESAPAEIALLRALRHQDARVRRNAAAVLGQLAADWAVEPLRDAMFDDNELIRRTAQAALRRIGTPEALQALETPPPGISVTVTLAPPAALAASPPDIPPPAADPDATEAERPALLPEAFPPITEEDTQPTLPPVLSDDVS